MSQLQIKRSGVIIATVEIDENTVFNQEWMGVEKITSTFTLSNPIDIRVNDYIEFLGEKYTIKNGIPCDQSNGSTFKYNVEFFSPTYYLYNVPMMHLDRVKFSYVGTPLEVLSLIIENLNNEEAGWSIGDCSLISEPETFNFDQQSCRTALTTLAETFKLEYKVKGKKIYLLEKLGETQNIVLKYGRGYGLINAARQAVDREYATVWRFYGGSTNLPEGYRNSMDRIALDSPYLLNDDIYGRKHGSVIFEDVFPRRTGSVTAIDGLNAIIDNTLDFDLNIQSISDGGAKIVFKSGELSGGEFVIKSYNPTTKKITFGDRKDETTGYVTPNASFTAAVGDKYTLMGIIMPQTYVDAAEAEVLALGTEHAKANSFPPVAFPLNIDEKFIRDMQLIYKIVAGDYVYVISEALGINTKIRMQSISYPLVNPANIAGVVSDVAQYSTVEKLKKDVIQNKKETAKSVAVALYARQLADEISNAAILNQFQRTYVGDQAILTGAFVAGNPEDGAVAGINGAENDPETIRFWAGSSFADKENAPFRVSQSGDVVMRNATLQSSAAGKRIEINSKENNLRFYDEAGNTLIDFDDDSALEGISITPNDPPSRPTLHFTYGPGIRVGNFDNNLGGSSISRKGFFSNGVIECRDIVTEKVVFKVENGNIMLAGNIVMAGAIQISDTTSGGITMGEEPGLSTIYDVRVGGDSFVRLKWVKGILVGITPR
ncbi:phage tail protein [Pedobacter sp. D749]|uniref:phage tail protein n=1 Tax=Pedobacter sp. D749 TaxID=2856523 RepID=UPI001C56E41E|nr:phage tail protein [Pedobacter sp. D749]QXU42093.1 phage tail protein [Pedobacter sp. D749]